jgi:phage terminase large subunit
MEVQSQKRQGSEIKFNFNCTFSPVFTTNKRYIDVWGGRGRGGSHFGTDYFLFLISCPGYFRGYFVRQAFNDIRDSLFRDFKDRITDNDTLNIEDFSINESEMRIIYKPTGNMIISKGVKKDGNRTAKMKSLAGATHVLMEEADEVGEDDFDQMDDSLRTMKVEHLQIIRIFNPPFKQHWIWRGYTPQDSPVEGYFTMQAKEDSNTLSIFSTYKSNIANVNESTIEKFEGYKKNKPEYYYTIIKGLISEGQKGRIFSGWVPINDDTFNQIDAASVFGLDFGSATGGFVEGKIVKNNFYLRELFYGGATALQLAVMMAKLGIVNQVVIADSADPLKIAKLRNGWTADELLQGEAGGTGLTLEEVASYPVLINGFNIFGVVKPKGSVVFGIDLMKDHNIFATEGSINLWKEYRDYKWMLDKNKNPTDEPEDQNNHCIDPSRYILVSKGRYF